MKTQHLIITGFIFFVIAAICSDGYFHPDEHFQLLEFANYKMGGISGEHLPWEFDEQMRPTFQVVIVYGLCVMLKSMGLFDPFVASMLLRFLSAGLMFYSLYLFYNRYKTQLNGEKSEWWFAGLTFLLWFVPFISVRYSSESFGTIFMLIALLRYDRPDKQKIDLYGPILTGLYLGISFICRFQMGFMIFGFGAWVLFIKRERFAAMAGMLFGFLVAVGVGLICDHWFYGEWVSSAYNYFYQNLVENKAAGFGVSPFWYYAQETLLFVFPLFGFIVVLTMIAFFYKKPKHIFTWMLIPFLLVHHIIGHKELRFLFPVSPFIPFIVVVVMEKIKWLKHVRFLKYLFWTINISMLLVMSMKPAYDNVEMFKYIYRNQKDTEVYYIRETMPFMMYQFELANKPFVKGKDLKMTFFHRKDFHPHPVDNIAQLAEIVKNIDKPVAFVVRSPFYWEKYKAEIDGSGLKQKVVYQTYHSWLRFINFGNWLSDENVGAWTVVELSK